MKVELSPLFVMTVHEDDWSCSCFVCFYSKGMRQMFLGRNVVDPWAIVNVMRVRKISTGLYKCAYMCVHTCICIHMHVCERGGWREERNENR
jgi:hypothetical protein